MDWADTPEHAQFRSDVRTFIQERFPKNYRPDFRAERSLEPEDVPGYNWAADVKSEDPERRAAALEWTRALAEQGWVAPHWPKEYGGAGLTALDEFILNEETARAGVPLAGGIGVSLLGPTLLKHGTDEQRSEHLPKMISGEVLWAQGFSEPESGSDLASLKTRAVRDGDEYVVNGQKIWTSHAQYADWLFALVRTDPDAPKHRGITFLMMDMSTPGISVRPILDMRGGVPFNEIFLDNVRVPVKNRVGEENRGWYVAMTTLDYERSGIGATVVFKQILERLAKFVGSDGAARLQRNGRSAGLRQEIAQRYIELNVLYTLALRTVWMQAEGKVPNYEASVNQFYGAEFHQRLAQTAMKAIGLYGNLWEREGAPLNGMIAHGYLDAAANTVLSGTSEIQRNVVATRGLGLPRQ